MKKIIVVFISLFTVLMLFGCDSKKDYTAQDVADSIADISADNEGNVIVTLVNGKTFSLGNMNGEKGDKGDNGDKGDTGERGAQGLQGIQGPQGPQGPAGAKGKDGKDGINGKDGKDGEIPTDYVADLEFIKDFLVLTYPDGSKVTINPKNETINVTHHFEIDPPYPWRE